MKNFKEIIERMETRTNCTEKAKKVLFEIMEELSGLFQDRLTLENPTNVGCKWEYWENGWVHQSSCNGEIDANIAVKNGVVGIYKNYSNDHFGIYGTTIDLDDVNYISIPDAVVALKSLIEKMESINTNELGLSMLEDVLGRLSGKESETPPPEMAE